MSLVEKGPGEILAQSIQSGDAEASGIDSHAAARRRLVRKTDLIVMPGLGEKCLRPYLTRILDPNFCG